MKQTASSGPFQDGDYLLYCYDPADRGAVRSQWLDERQEHRSVHNALGSVSSRSCCRVPQHRRQLRWFLCLRERKLRASTLGCSNAAGQPNDGEPVRAAQNVAANQWRYGGNTAHRVSRQHQVILHEPLLKPQAYYCWDYATQAACANFTPGETAEPGFVYTVSQDPWNDNCFWSNADDKKIGVWNISHTGTGLRRLVASATSRLWPKRSRWSMTLGVAVVTIRVMRRLM